APPQLSALSLHDALPIYDERAADRFAVPATAIDYLLMVPKHAANGFAEELVMRAYLITRLARLLRSDLQSVFLSAFLFASYHVRSEEHTSELQSLTNLVC